MGSLVFGCSGVDINRYRLVYTLGKIRVFN